MTAYFIWKEEYGVGVPELDDQHRYLFRLGNSIQDSADSEVEAYAHKLYIYTKKHFVAEESHMSEISFPLVVEHMKLHNALLRDLNTILHGVVSKGEDFEKLKLFFLNWLVEHILYHDKQYFKYTRRSGSGKK